MRRVIVFNQSNMILRLDGYTLYFGDIQPQRYGELMNRKLIPLILASVVLWIAQLACNLPSSQENPDTFATLNALYTASAQTLEAAGTQVGFSPTPGLPLPTATSEGFPSPTSPAGVQSPVPSSRCDAAQFLADVTYPDGSVIPRGSTFIKTWRIKNVGTCAWTTSYAVVFVSGDSMNAPAAVPMPGTVQPGHYIEIPVQMTAPGTDGSYAGYWKLRNASGVVFGIGAQADSPFWVKVKVGGPSHVAYNFVDAYCNAEWSNGSDILPCPGTDGDASGFVVRLNKPKLENGAPANAPGLITFPQDKRNGVISGQYPAFDVKAGDRFRSLIHCGYDAPKCDVIFRLDYRSGGQVKTLGNWREIHEGKYFSVDIDLNSLAGQTVKFILFVSANGGNNQDYALWINPHIFRQGAPPPTQTPSATPTQTMTPTPTPTQTATETPTETPEP